MWQLHPTLVPKTGSEFSQIRTSLTNTCCLGSDLLSFKWSLIETNLFSRETKYINMIKIYPSLSLLHPCQHTCLWLYSWCQGSWKVLQPAQLCPEHCTTVQPWWSQGTAFWGARCSLAHQFRKNHIKVHVESLNKTVRGKYHFTTFFLRTLDTHWGKDTDLNEVAS